MQQYRFNPPPTWPPPPTVNWRPRPGWTPPTEWGPVPDGWQLWVPVKRSIWAHPLMIVAYVLVPLFLIGSIAGAVDPDAPTNSAGTSATPVDQATTEAPATDAAPAESTDEPVPEATTEEPSEDPTTEKPDPEPTVYKTLTARKWKKIAKDPDAYLGETYVVYGQVTQFDAATGTDTFLADIGAVRSSCDYGFCDYATNTFLTGDETRLSKLVEDDVFRAKVVILGSMSYETQIGGETTVPALQVDRVKLLG